MSASDSLSRLYETLWDAHGTDAFAALDQPATVRGPDFLLELADQAGLGEDAVIADLGCGRGNHAVTLAQRYGGRVVAIDPLEPHLRETHQRARAEEVTDRLRVESGTAEAIPLADGATDFVWCRDVLEHVSDVSQALSECRRVLTPGGHLLLQSGFATARLEAGEAARLRHALRFGDLSLDLHHAERCIGDTGFRIVRSEDLGSELAEHYECRDGRCSRELLRLARLLRHRPFYEQQLGADAVQTAMGLYEWTLGQLMGKVSYHVWLLQSG